MTSVCELNVLPLERFRELLQFNFLPTQDIDDSWWRSEWLAGTLLNPKQFPACAQFHLSRFFLRKRGLADQFDFDFSADEKQIALLPGKRLKRLVYLAGLTLQSQRIAHVIRGSDRQAIKSSVSEEDYFFAIKRGAFLLKEARFESTAPFDKGERFDRLNEDCYRLGVNNLATVMRKFSPAFVGRLQSKLPKTMVEDYWQAADSDCDAHTRLLLRLTKEID